jgi:ubiquinone biosynthesis monooxygenase Coq7
MLEQERQHLERFNALMSARHVRPTLLSPLWHIAGYALGAITAKLGPAAAMACTEAVEEVIDAHYESQAQRLDRHDPALKELILTCQKEEQEHRDISRERGARNAPLYPLLTTAIKAGSRLAIWLSKRV